MGRLDGSAPAHDQWRRQIRLEPVDVLDDRRGRQLELAGRCTKSALADNGQEGLGVNQAKHVGDGLLGLLTAPRRRRTGQDIEDAAGGRKLDLSTRLRDARPDVRGEDRWGG